MFLSQKLSNRILDDNIFSLKLALLISQKTSMPLKQHTLEHQVKRKSTKLLLPIYIEAYKELGINEDDIVEKNQS